MAKVKSNKSQAIRDFFGTNPKAKAREVVAALAKKGIAVTEGLVYAVKGGMNERKRRQKRVAKAAMVASGGSVVGNGMVHADGGHGVSIKSDALMMIREVKALAAKAGGFAKLKDLVDAIAE